MTTEKKLALINELLNELNVATDDIIVDTQGLEVILPLKLKEQQWTHSGCGGDDEGWQYSSC